ncbi:transcriptional regulator with XRE-family HTH domain [Elusimicrobium simillimum]|uniref:helix-turn-helix transcriptional regulator n=1 Tax=Elusimicrobium simillimum TaxID=3143438 RepID=UPI003C6FDDE9
MESTIIGRNIKKARILAEMTQDDLANAVEKSQQTVVSWESGEFTPRPKTLERIAKELNQPLSFFYQTEDNIFSTNKTIMTSEVRDSENNSLEHPDMPQSIFKTIGMLKKGEVTFLNDKDIPTPNNVFSPDSFSIIVKDDSISPDFKEAETLQIIKIRRIEPGLNDKYYLIQIKEDLFIFKCHEYLDKVTISIGKTKKDIPAKNINILGRVVSVQRLV